MKPSHCIAYLAQIVKPPEFNCLGSLAASKVPFPKCLRACAVVLPGAMKLTFAPICLKKAVVSLLYPFTPNNSLPHSKETVLGLNWSCSRGWARDSAEVRFWSRTCQRCWTTSVMMRDPPADACEMYMVPLGNSTMVGLMEDSGRAWGFMKFAGEGG